MGRLKLAVSCAVLAAVAGCSNGTTPAAPENADDAPTTTQHPTERTCDRIEIAHAALRSGAWHEDPVGLEEELEDLRVDLWTLDTELRLRLDPIVQRMKDAVDEGYPDLEVRSGYLELESVCATAGTDPADDAARTQPTTTAAESELPPTPEPSCASDGSRKQMPMAPAAGSCP